MRWTRSFRARRPGLIGDALKIRLALETLENRTLPNAGSLTGLLTVVQPHSIPPSDHVPVSPISQGQPPPVPPNVLVNNPAEDGNSRQDTQSETSLVVAGNTVITGFNDSNAYNGNNTHFTGFSRSTNSGASYQDLGSLPSVSGGDAGDPVLARDNTTGRVYFATLSFTSTNIDVFRSDDNFQTFLSTTIVSRSGGFLDKEWMAVDNASGAGQGNVYLIIRDFGSGNGIYLYRSTDHGSTFTASNGGTAIVSGSSGNVQGAWVTTGPDHAVYALWYDATSSTPSIKIRKSTDQGQTFGPAVTVTTLSTSLGVNGDLSLGGFRSNAFPQAVVNPSNGQIYVVYDNKGTGSDRADVFFRQSNDGGATWGAAVKLNDDTTTRDQWQPSLAVTPDGQHVGVFWYDRRLDSANTLIDRFGVVGTVSGTTVSFGVNQRISDTSFPTAFGQDPVVNGIYMGDYDQAAADNNFFYVNWGDNRDNSLGHSGKNSNVRFAKLPVVASTGASHYTIDAPSTVNVGDSFSITVTAANDVGEADPKYQGTIHFSSTDIKAGLPDDYTFTADDAGVHTFDGLSLSTAGNQTITGTDTKTESISGAAVITVFRVGTSHFAFSAPASTITGQPFSLTVRATMDNGQVDPNYQGTVTFTSTDPSAGLPADYTFTADDAGVHTFDGVTLSTLGSQRITATDTSDNTITGTVSITVTPPTLFQPHVDYGTGPAPTSAAVGDFNGDGIPDIAVANQGTAPNYADGSVTILLGNGDGTFTVAGTYPAGYESNAMSVGDFNGDGILDIVVANFGIPGSGANGDVSVLIGNGDGTFQAAVHYQAGTGPSSAEVGDFNGDGIPDVVVSNNLSNNVSVLLGNGDGTFQAAVNYATGTGPVEVAINDYNGDGIPDMAVVNQRSNNVTILLGNGDGTFQLLANVAVGAGAQSVFSADLNGDGIPDLITANFSAGTVSVLLGNGDGTFQAPRTFTVGASPSEVAVDDFNADGIPDIVVTNSGSNTVSVLLGNGDGSFQPQLTYATGAQPWFVTSADFNGDGAEDLVVVDVAGNGVSILLNTNFFSPGSSLAGKLASDATLETQAAAPVRSTPVESTAHRRAETLDPAAVDQYLGLAVAGEHHATSLRLSRLLTRPIADGWLDLLRPDELLDL